MEHGTNKKASITRLKKRARALKRTVGITNGAALQIVSRDSGYLSFQAALARSQKPRSSSRLKASPDARQLAARQTAEGIDAAGPVVYKLEILEDVWLLAVGPLGPELWRASGTCSPRRIMNVGIFQTLAREVIRNPGSSRLENAGRWTVSRYGTRPVEPLDGYRERDIQMLAGAFGMPICGDWRKPPRQDFTEKMFLLSPAFAALRRAVRLGQLRPLYDDWMYGLSIGWRILTMLDDQTFVEFRHAAVDSLQSRRARDVARILRHWPDLDATVRSKWLDFGEAAQSAVRHQIAALLPHRLQRSIAASGCQ